MELRTQEITVDVNNGDLKEALENLRVNVGIRNSGDPEMIERHNRMAGERIFFWLSKRVPGPVFEGFMTAARRNGY